MQVSMTALKYQTYVRLGLSHGQFTHDFRRYSSCTVKLSLNNTKRFEINSDFIVYDYATDKRIYRPRSNYVPHKLRTLICETSDEITRFLAKEKKFLKANKKCRNNVPTAIIRLGNDLIAVNLNTCKADQNICAGNNRHFYSFEGNFAIPTKFVFFISQTDRNFNPPTYLGYISIGFYNIIENGGIS